MVISAGLVHPTLLCRRNLKSVLSERSGSQYEYSSNLETLSQLSNELYSSVILYFHKKEIANPDLDALEKFVFNGGGLLALHSASASFKQNERYYNLIGGRFIQHGKIHEFKVEPVIAESKVFGKIPGFSIVDELYIHKYLQDATVHFTTKVNKKAEPVVWTRELGKGRVTYCSLGHRADVLKSSSVKQILYRAMDWLDG